MCFIGHACGIRLPDSLKLVISRKNTMTSQFADMTPSSNFVALLLSTLVTGPSFMSTSWLVLELWLFSFMKNWLEIRKSKIPLSEFCPVSGGWGELKIQNLARMPQIKCYWMLQNARITVFTVSELLRENQQGGVKLLPFTQIRVELLFIVFNLPT